MPREASITQIDVNVIADQMHACGSKPTARAVYLQLGRGSMATVLRLLQVWQGEQKRAEDTTLQLPVGLQRALLDTIAREVANARTTLEEALAEAGQIQKDLIRENEAQQADLAGLSETLEKARSERDQFAGRLAQADHALGHSQAKAEQLRQEAEYARTEQAKAELLLEGMSRMEIELTTLRDTLATERDVRASAQQAAAVAEARMAQMEAWLSKTHQRLATFEVCSPLMVS
ncbi:DNA-binding protein [Rhodobacteraceae bacterium CH30]|nr:DNA-binding protein [Rhodobacteraceae bacterium CH30]